MKRTMNKVDAIQSLRPKASFSWDPDTDAISQWSCPDGSSIPSDSEIATAITNLQTAYNAKKYQRDRRPSYPFLEEQMDLLWHAIDADADLKTKLAGFYNAIKTVKDANPKP